MLRELRINFPSTFKYQWKNIYKVNEIINFIVILTIINFINSIRSVRIILTYENVNLPTMIAQYHHHNMTITEINYRIDNFIFKNTVLFTLVFYEKSYKILSDQLFKKG